VGEHDLTPPRDGLGPVAPRRRGQSLAHWGKGGHPVVAGIVGALLALAFVHLCRMCCSGRRCHRGGCGLGHGEPMLGSQPPVHGQTAAPTMGHPVIPVKETDYTQFA
jgi:hypothetical protein